MAPQAGIPAAPKNNNRAISRKQDSTDNDNDETTSIMSKPIEKENKKPVAAAGAGAGNILYLKSSRKKINLFT